MKIDILTLFPEMFNGPFDESIIRRAQDKGFVKIKIHNLRDWANDKHKTVDDRPYGGGKGMVIRVDVIHRALKNIKNEIKIKKSNEKIILLSPQGKIFNQKKAREFARLKHLILISGHYEGFDERIAKNLVDEEISIGDYVLTGGEIPAMVITDSIIRLIPGVLEDEATKHESFSKIENENKSASIKSKTAHLLDYPSYTRPEKYLDWKVPKVLLSGNHKEIEKWRQKKSLEITKQKRPDLIKD